MFEKVKENLRTNRDWKEKNKIYLKELQNFLDKADNIQDQRLRKMVIEQMLKCDNILTNLAEKEFTQYYEKGLKKQKKHKTNY